MGTSWSGNIGVFSEDEGYQKQCRKLEKLKRDLTYVKNTIKDKRIIGAKTLSDL